MDSPVFEDVKVGTLPFSCWRGSVSSPYVAVRRLVLCGSCMRLPEPQMKPYSVFAT